MTVRLAAPAKVNLHLEVLGRRPDGFHDLVSLFQAIDLVDVLRLERTGADGPVMVQGMPGIPPSLNLVARAIELFRRHAGLTEGVSAAIEKHIPIGAGFGGGSSDAAAVLRGLQVLFGSPLSTDEIADCARSLGSDVPFFLAGPAALAEGRGERLRVVAPRLDFALVAVTPRARVSTADAFAWLDEAGAAAAPGTPSSDAILRASRELAPESWRFSNSFDRVVPVRLPAIVPVRERMLAAGAPSPRLTGSGSTLIAVFGQVSDAAACARRLVVDPPPGCVSEDIRVLAPLASFPGVEYYG